MTGIPQLLAKRHAADVWIPECKMGSTFRGCRRLDGWALKRSWSPVTAVGYEIKESRSDFLRDEKMTEYLPVCHQLYLVTPSGLVAPQEVPGGMGLLWRAKTGSRLLTKLKAPRHEPDPAAFIKLLLYALMSRSRIVRGMDEANGPRDKLTYWREWLAKRDERRDLGYMVGDAIRAHCARVDAENDRLRDAHAGYNHLRARLEELGFDPEIPVNRWQIDNRLAELRGDARKVLHAVERARAELDRLSAALSERVHASLGAEEDK